MPNNDKNDKNGNTITVPFLNLQDVNRPYMGEMAAVAEQIIQSGWYIRGSACTTFERQFADYCGVEHCVGVGNGLEALTLTLNAWQILGKISPGSEVIIPGHTFIATALAVIDSGLTPVFVDVVDDTFLLSTNEVAAAITERTAAVVAVHLYGRPVDVDPLKQLCDANGLLLLEDAAQAHGAKYKGRRSGSLGDAAAFSFYPGKNLGALGDGGAVTTNDNELADCIRSLGNYGSAEKYVNIYAGRNSRLDDLQAAFLSIKLRHLDDDNEHRRRVASRYAKEITNPAVCLPTCVRGLEHAWHLYVVRVQSRHRFQKHLEQQGIATSVHYPIPPHKQVAFPALQHISLPTTEAMHREVVSLPISPAITEPQVQAVIDAVNLYRTSPSP